MASEYDQYWKRFSIEEFIKRLEPLGLLETANACTLERRELEKISISKKIPSHADLQYRKQQYFNFLGGLGYILDTGGMAGTFSATDKQLAKMVIERLVQKNHLKPEALNIFSQ